MRVEGGLRYCWVPVSKVACNVSQHSRSLNSDTHDAPNPGALKRLMINKIQI